MTPEQIAAELTSIYRTPTGTMSLRPLQGQCLLAGEGARGLVTNAAVGLGKSLIVAILMRMIGGSRPMVFTESSNLPQMRADFERYRAHFQIPTAYRLEAYERLSSVYGAGMLEEIKPTALFLDEAHKVKFGKPRARRIDRYRRARGLGEDRIPVCCLSGSPGTEMVDYAHLFVWAIPSLASIQGGPIPTDEDGNPTGAEFKKFCKRLREDEQFHDEVWEIIRGTEGVVISAETFTDIPLHIKHTVLPTSEAMLPHWERLRDLGEAPDGYPLDALGEQWGLARCLSNDMYYEHVPRPPQPWKEARKDWNGFCSAVVEATANAKRPYDTPGQIKDAVLAGRLPVEPYATWAKLEPTYEFIKRPVFLDDSAIQYAIAWGRERAAQAKPRSNGAIIWVEQTGIGEEIERRTGWPFYSKGARNRQRQHVTKADHGGPPAIVCSVDSCGTGKNLQRRYAHNLFMNPPSNFRDAEQYLGRTHRPGQTEDCVHAEFLYGCLEDWIAVRDSLRKAERNEESLTSPRKLTLARHDWDDYPGDAGGPAWVKSNGDVQVTL